MLINKYIFKMAWRNITRNKRRTALSVIAIMLAVMIVCFAQSYVEGLLGSMKSNVFRFQTGHIKILNKNYLKEQKLMPLDLNIYGYSNDYREVMQTVKTVAGVKTVLPRTKFIGMVNMKGKMKYINGFALDAEREKNVLPLADNIIKGRMFRNFNPDTVAQEMVMSAGLAYELDLQTGDKITLMAKDAHEGLTLMDFKIAGLVSFGVAEYDSIYFYIPLSTAARFLKMPFSVMELTVFLKDTADSMPLASVINKKIKRHPAAPFQAYPWEKQENGRYGKMFAMYDVLIPIIYFVFLFLASLVIINTTMMVVYERMREIGTIAAMGMRGNRIIQLFFYEAVIISIIGSLSGTLAGGSLAYIFSITGIDFSKFSGGMSGFPITDIVYFEFTPGLLVFSFLFGIVVASLFSFIPSSKAARLEPVKALKGVF
ncbi:MAG TPA: FtsX-like permease family protein [Spirochaetota bacterium]|nr:FtsX-like permease family protein [Spirochaetota bacterium]